MERIQESKQCYEHKCHISNKAGDLTEARERDDVLYMPCQFWSGQVISKSLDEEDEGEREEKKLQEVAESVGNSRSVTDRLWILMSGTLPPLFFFCSVVRSHILYQFKVNSF